MIYTTIQTWKDSRAKIAVDEGNEPVRADVEQVRQTVEQARALGLPKAQTVEYVSSVFVDPAKAPSGVSVQFVRENLAAVIASISSENDWPSETEFKEVADRVESDSTMVFKAESNGAAKYIVIKNRQAMTDAVMEMLKSCDARLMYPNVRWMKSTLIK